MAPELTEESRMDCPLHGIRRPTVVCRHLQHGEDLGFNVPPEPDPEMPWLQTAWCDACDAIFKEEGGWNERSEAFASILFICEGCFRTIRSRNLGADGPDPRGKEGAHREWN